MDTIEKQLLEGAAATMAEELLKRPGVRAVQLIDVPHHTDGPPFYLGAEYRLLVVVDDKLAEQYKQRLASPAIISYQDGNDNATWWDERMETPQEAAYHLLGTNEATFYEVLDEIAGGVNDIDIILLPESWTNQAGRILECLRTNLDGSYVFNNYRVFDPNTRTFVSPS
jgi:hypothetical protein